MGLRTDQQFAVAVRGETSAILTRALGEEAGMGKSALMAAAFQSAADHSQATAKGGALTLYDCDRSSVARAIAICTLANVMPGGAHPEVYLIPKRSGPAVMMQAWIAPAGYRKIARSAGYFVQELPVYTGEEQQATEAAGKVASGGVFVPVPRPAEPSLNDLVGYYVVIRSLTNAADARVEFISREDLDKRRKVGGPVWRSWPRMMYRKTALKFVFARGLVPMGQELRAAAELEHEQEPVVDTVELKAAQKTLAADLGLPDESIDAEILDTVGVDELWAEANRIGAAKFSEVADCDSPDDCAGWNDEQRARLLADLKEIE